MIALPHPLHTAVAAQDFFFLCVSAQCMGETGAPVPLWRVKAYYFAALPENASLNPESWDSICSYCDLGEI